MARAQVFPSDTACARHELAVLSVFVVGVSEASDKAVCSIMRVTRGTRWFGKRAPLAVMIEGGSDSLSLGFPCPVLVPRAFSLSMVSSSGYVELPFMILKFIALLLLCQLAGEVFVTWSGLPVPGPVVGMVSLFVGLVIRGGIPGGLGRLVDGLLSHLSLLFVPAGVGVMQHIAMLRDEWLAISVALVLSAVLTIAVTGLVMTVLMRRMARSEEEG